MPIEFWTSLRLDLLLTRCWGPVRMDDFRQTLAKLQVDENYRPGRTELTDLTEARHVDASFGNLWSVLNAVNNQIPGQRVRTRTVLIAPDDVMFGVGRMYQTLAQNSGGIEVEIYRSEGDALKALGLKVTSIQALRGIGDFRPHTCAGHTHNEA